MGRLILNRMNRKRYAWRKWICLMLILITIAILSASWLQLKIFSKCEKLIEFSNFIDVLDSISYLDYNSSDSNRLFIPTDSIGFYLTCYSEFKYTDGPDLSTTGYLLKIRDNTIELFRSHSSKRVSRFVEKDSSAGLFNSDDVWLTMRFDQCTKSKILLSSNYQGSISSDIRFRGHRVILVEDSLTNYSQDEYISIWESKDDKFNSSGSEYLYCLYIDHTGYCRVIHYHFVKKIKLNTQYMW